MKECLEVFSYIKSDVARRQILEHEGECYDQYVFRALYSNEITVGDFIPSIFDMRATRKKGYNPDSPGSYSVSLFPSLDVYRLKCDASKGFRTSHPAVAVGKTSLLRGYSCRDNDIHVSYFLYDYEDNSPAEDFKIKVVGE